MSASQIAARDCRADKGNKAARKRPKLHKFRAAACAMSAVLRVPAFAENLRQSCRSCRLYVRARATERAGVDGVRATERAG